MTLIPILIFIGLPCYIEGNSSRINIESRFIHGDVYFTWNFSTSLPSPYVYISNRGNPSWILVKQTNFTVKDVLLYDFINIDANDGSARIGDIWKYKVSKVLTKPGDCVRLKWTVPFFPKTGKYQVFHIYKQNKSIISLDTSTNNVSYQGNNQSSKYKYLSKLLYSEDISFEIRDITLDDAGYYNSGHSVAAAQTGGGVVLIVNGKPEKPIISGKLDIPVNGVAALDCSAKSTSAPDYYQKLVNLSYTWFLNNKTMEGRTTETIELKITKDHKFNNYSCMAKEMSVESDRSDPVQINPLYGPKEISITPESNMRFNKEVIVKEGDLIGPFTCQADCNPPCIISWTYDNLDKPVEINSSRVEVNASRNISCLHCSAKWNSEKIIKNITVDVQYFEKPVLFINGTHRSKSVLKLHENTKTQLSCLVDGNPIPSIHLRFGNVRINIQNSKWANYTLVSAQCNDTNTYSCTGNSTVFNFGEQIMQINVTCKLRIDNSSPLFRNTYASTSGNNVKVAIAIPVIANPPPQAFDIQWEGPTEHPFISSISQRGVAYKHWINTSVPVNDHTYFGNYTMKYRNDTLLIIRINAQDRPAMPLNFTGSLYKGGNINLTWVPGFNGGSIQYFILSKRNKEEWEMVANISESGEGKMAYIETGSFSSGQDIWYRLQSCNVINCSIQSTEIKVQFNDLSTGSLVNVNTVTYAAIGASTTLFILSFILIVVLVKYFKRKTEAERLVETENEILQGSEMYAVVDKSESTKNRTNDAKETNDANGDKNDDMLHGTEMYSTVEKSLLKKEREPKPKHTTVTEKKNTEKRKQKNKPFEENNASSVGSRKTNDEGLIYIEVDFPNQPKTSDTTEKPVIHGEEDRTEYTFVDFSKKASPTQKTLDQEGK